MASTRELTEALTPAILANPEVSGVGITPDGGALKVFVRTLRPEFHGVPRQIGGFDVELVPQGIPRALDSTYGYGLCTRCLDRSISPTGVCSPIHARPRATLVGGLSCGPATGGTGTIAAIVRDAGTNAPVILSNNHVLAGTAFEDTPDRTGLEIQHPGQADPDGEVVAALTRYVPLRDRFRYGESPGGTNLVDGAIAALLPGTPYQTATLMDDQGLEVPIRGWAAATGTMVHKYGRTTGHTWGRITATNVATDVNYGYNDYVRFTDLIRVDPQPPVSQGGLPMTCPGDSGSLLLDSNNNAIGLLFCGNYARAEETDPVPDGSAYACTIENVMQALNILIAPETGEECMPGQSICIGTTRYFCQDGVWTAGITNDSTCMAQPGNALMGGLFVASWVGILAAGALAATMIRKQREVKNGKRPRGKKIHRTRVTRR